VTRDRSRELVLDRRPPTPNPIPERAAYSVSRDKKTRRYWEMTNDECPTNDQGNPNHETPMTKGRMVFVIRILSFGFPSSLVGHWWGIRN
jgi:hypothetical protein